ncbi:hypothetical protein ILYODFUR_003794 [Ilyodon furcidens]|uniref:CMP/dCMP-type deaminase domain-containing protein n=1 Tax=Ilyodon furcidens TaxID=33524 RepID=A0ABV0UD28_9TELE
MCARRNIYMFSSTHNPAQCSSTQLRNPTKKAAWEFPETEIELVLSQAEQKAVAGAWIIVQDKVLTAGRTQRHHTSTDNRCLGVATQKCVFKSGFSHSETASANRLLRNYP